MSYLGLYTVCKTCSSARARSYVRPTNRTAKESKSLLGTGLRSLVIGLYLLDVYIFNQWRHYRWVTVTSPVLWHIWKSRTTCERAYTAGKMETDFSGYCLYPKVGALSQISGCATVSSLVTICECEQLPATKTVSWIREK